jgi:hypothetical protein
VLVIRKKQKDPPAGKKKGPHAITNRLEVIRKNVSDWFYK